MSDKLQKPFLKWVGGKSQMINDIMNKFPNEMNSYHELFLGGGSVLFALLSLRNEGKIIVKRKINAYDINIRLINIYKHIQNNKKELYKHIKFYITEYDNIKGNNINRNASSLKEAKSSKESYYYWIRKKYNNIDIDSIESSALFMFLNKTCFRGIYREGPNGFNVPYGHYKKTPVIITEDELNNVSKLIKNVNFIHSDFSNSIKRIKQGDFVYIDPPYAPEQKTSFVGYVSDGFDLDKHNLLFNEIKKLNNKKIQFIMSNSKVKLVTDFFKDYNMTNINARRAINSKNPSSTTTEVIIYN